MPKGCFVSSGLTASPLRTAQAQTVLSVRVSRRSQAHAGNALPVRRLKPVGPCARRLMPLVSCSAVVDRPPESELHSADLGWPRGFPSRYVLGDQLGRGSFGIVYLATDRVSGEEVAAKIIPKERKGTTRDHIIEKIQQEVCFCSIKAILTASSGLKSCFSDNHAGRCAAQNARKTRGSQIASCLRGQHLHVSTQSSSAICFPSMV